MTFRVRTALVVLVLTAFTMGGAFATVWQRFVASQRAQLDGALLEVARAEARDADARGLDFSNAPGPSANAVGPLPKYGALYGSGGRVISTTSNLGVESAPTMPRLVELETGFDLELTGRPMRGIMVIVPGTAMRVLLATPREDLEDDAGILARAMTIAFAVGCLWAAIVAFGVATKLTKEHSLVGEVARRVASGDTSARVAFRTQNADLRQLADDLNAMIERLVGLLAVQERFIAHASHELRTPLTALRVELELALRRKGNLADNESAMKGALESARRLSGLAEDLLQLARVRHTAPTEQVTSVTEALERAIADVEPLGRPRNVVVDVEPFTADVAGDDRGLTRLFRNLLENAVRFSPDLARVRVWAEREDDRLDVTVADEGPGIDPEEEERIFEPFARALRGNQTDGTGLGLSIARELARSFGGEIVVARPVNGRGARFVVTLRAA